MEAGSGLDPADAGGLADAGVGAPELTSRFTSVPGGTSLPALKPDAMTLPSATLALGNEVIWPTLSPDCVSACCASPLVNPANSGTLTFSVPEDLVGGSPFAPVKSNQPFVASVPMTACRTPSVPRKNRRAATATRTHGILLRRRTGAGLEGCILFVGVEGATAAGFAVRRVRDPRVPVRTATGERPRLTLQRSSASSSALP